MIPNTKKPIDFKKISLRLASPERIKEWSYGEVTKPETVNYRTQRSERNGLFDERIFGPEKDYECYCGKYRRIRYKDIVCEKCGVEVTRSIVRRERMGHIELATPVAHIWFVRSIPSKIGLLLGITSSDVEKVIYFSGYIIIKTDESEKAKVYKELDSEYKSKLKTLKTDEGKSRLKESLTSAKKELDSIKEWAVVDEIQYHNLSTKYGHIFEASVGAESIHNIFRKIDLQQLQAKTIGAMEKAGAAEKIKLGKKLNIIRSLIRSGVRPEWMFLKIIPVIPPALRPMVALEGGRHATSDVNDLYRRVINRNNRLKKLMEINAPDVIQRNEKRILQEAVDALIDNSVGEAAGNMRAAQRRPLKSLSDNLKGKQGRFRQNLLGKRVDYSARSVIVIGPELKLHQCGLPKHMVLELFRPFVISKLIERELAFNIRGAGKLIDEEIPEVWEILEEIIKGKRVLLNRAPTLHRLGIQAFEPILIEGNAIQVHPLVCSAFNADFDGDQMAVHLPLSVQAQKEAREIMASEINILRPGNNEVTTRASLDIILGCYWMTNIPGEGKKREELRFFGSPNAAIRTYDFGHLDLRQEVLVLPTEKARFKGFNGELMKTSVGRLLFNSFLPDDFPYINHTVRLKDMTTIVDNLIDKYGLKAMPNLLDKIKQFGFRYAKKSGVSWGIDDVKVPGEKPKIVTEAKEKTAKNQERFDEGLISSEEKLRMFVEIWGEAKKKIDDAIPATLEDDGSVMNLMDSGARGTMTNISQLSGMKGLIVNPSNETVEFPVIPSYKEGLSPLEYFVTTHGSRKGLTDTALNTAKAGYLTRKLVYVADSLMVSENDCGDTEGRVLARREGAGVDSDFASNIRGRHLLEDVKDGKGKVLYKKGTLLYKKDALEINDSDVSEVHVRSPLSCKTVEGVCQICYGLDLGRNKPVEMGETVGVVAAQAIGEPGTQLTMRTFHSGGVASGSGDITTGLPRVEEVFEKRAPKNPAIIADVNGQILDIEFGDDEQIINVLIDPESRGKTKTSKEKKEYSVPVNRTIRTKKGAAIKKGDVLTDGSVDISNLFKFAGRSKTEDYILHEIHKIYQRQGGNISRKHIEIIVRQMFSRMRIKDPGDTIFAKGEVVNVFDLERENKITSSEKGEKAVTEDVVLGISEVSMTTSSFLSAASFENTQKVLTNTAVRGAEDGLRGLKENVIIGRLIPAGTGWGDKRKEFEKDIIEKKEERES